MQSDSAASASKTTEQAGSMISSRKTMCTGNRARGHPNNTGSSDMPAMGMCTEKMKVMAFFRLSKIRRPMRTAETMEAKSSSSKHQGAPIHGPRRCPVPPWRCRCGPL